MEAIAVAGEMADKYPDHPKTPLLLLTLGGSKWREYEKQKNTSKGKQAKQDAVMIYNLYIKACPDHKYIQDVRKRLKMVEGK